MEFVLVSLVALLGVVVVTAGLQLFGGRLRLSLHRAELELSEAAATLRSTQQAVALSEREEEAVETFSYQDYVNREALEELADAKSIRFDPEYVERSQTDTRGEGFSTNTGVSVGPSTLGQISSEVGTSTTRGESDTRTLGFHRRRTVRVVVDELVAALEAEGSLYRDLSAAPESGLNEAALIRELTTAKVEWGLVDLAEDDPSTEVDDALMMTRRAAVDILRGLKIDDFKKILSTKRAAFAVVVNHWRVTENDRALSLYSSRLYVGGRRKTGALAHKLMRVELIGDNLAALARSKYSAGVFLDLQVFAKIESIQTEDDEEMLVLTPIAIFSE